MEGIKEDQENVAFYFIFIYVLLITEADKTKPGITQDFKYLSLDALFVQYSKCFKIKWFEFNQTGVHISIKQHFQRPLQKPNLNLYWV